VNPIPEDHGAIKGETWLRTVPRDELLNRVVVGALTAPGGQAAELIAIRVDPGVLDQFRREARRRRVGYQTLINEVLARHVRKNVA
jgi:uncharacterized protein (DUF4415 family)